MTPLLLNYSLLHFNSGLWELLFKISWQTCSEKGHGKRYMDTD